MVDAIKGRWLESREAHRVDALVDLVLTDDDAPTAPASMVHVVVDYDALMRGHTVAGEVEAHPERSQRSLNPDVSGLG